MRVIRILASIAALCCGAASASAAPISAGDLVIYRVGTGGAGLTSAATAVFVDEYTTAGTLVQSIAMPTTANGNQLAVTASGTATSEGFLNLSKDGRYVVLTGYNAAPGTAGIAGTASATTPRVVGRIDASGAVDTSTNFTNAYTGNNIRSAYTTDGTTIWASGAGGASAGGVWVASFGASSGTQVSASTGVANTRVLEDFLSQLYVSSSSGSNVGVNTVGSGEPTTSGQAVSLLVGSASAYDFYMADLDAGVAGVDTLYIADDTSSTGGIKKFSLVGGVWTSNGTAGLGADAYRGLTGSVDANGVHLFAIRKGGSGAAGGGELVSLVDGSGYNGAFSGTPTLLATAATNTSFRGIDFAPVAVPEPSTWVLMVVGVAAALIAKWRPRMIA